MALKLRHYFDVIRTLTFISVRICFRISITIIIIPTPPLSQHFALNEKQVLMLA